MRMFIVFDSPFNAYYSGQNVTGRLVVTVDKPKKFRSITIHCKGESHVRWEEHRTERDKDGRTRSITDVYTGHEQYFKVYSRATGETELHPGEYSWPFGFLLPQNIPSSFEGTYGYIRYTVKAVMDRPWRFNHDCKAAFTVVSPLDLNMMPAVKEPVFIQQSKTFCCLWCQSGPLELSVELPCTGFVPGQTIPFKVDIENNSNVLVYPVNGVLRKDVIWTAHSPWRKQKVEKVVMANIAVNKRVDPHTTQAFCQNIKIPPVPPSNLQNCGIIDLDYVFKVEAVAEAFHKNLSAKIPITLGTIPLLTGPMRFIPPVPSAPDQRSLPGYSDPAPLPSAPEKRELSELPAPVAPAPSLPLPSTFVPPTDPSSAPSAPPPAYADLPPPSYEECVFGGRNIKESDDGEYTQGLTDFVPRYPVWNFEHQN